jgi:surface antigen/LysM repeat protein
MIIRNMIKLRFADRLKTVTKQPVQAKTRSRTKFRLKPALVAVYASTFVLVVAVVFIGYRQPQKTTELANVSNVNSISQIDQTSVDNVIATDVASNVAKAANLPIATSVANMAISAQTKSEFSQPDSLGTTKPQLIGADITNRSIVNHTALAGDTVDILAAKYNVSKETIKWANNLTSDALPAGSVVKILPVDGVLYTVKATDTVDSIAAKYAVDKNRLVLYNDLEVSGLAADTSIILPSATLPGEERPGYVAPVNYYAFTGTGFGGKTWNISYGSGSCPTYGYGYCTCYAYSRRVQLGLGVGSHWGDASSWAPNASREGYIVDRSPSVGSIIQNGGGAGHVAIVEAILPNGDLSISEMNAHVFGGGWNIVSGRIVPASNISQYNYIH